MFIGVEDPVFAGYGGVGEGYLKGTGGRGQFLWY